MEEPLQVVGAAVIRANRCLLARRGPALSHAGAWEFPGGKVEPGETPQEALRREVAEELGIDIEVGEFLAHGKSREGGRRIALDVYLARLIGGEIRLSEHSHHAWLTAADLAWLDTPPADQPVIAALGEYLLEIEKQHP